MNTFKKVLFPKSNIPKVKNLYLSTVIGNVFNHGEGIRIQRNSKVSFNSYFNSFYESYWNKYCELGKVYFTLRAAGSGRVMFYRDTTDNGCYEIFSKEFSSSNIDNEIDFELFFNDTFHDEGRIFFDIEANEQDILIKAIEFKSSIPAKQRLSIGICTFNREDMLLDNLESVLALSKRFKNLSQVFVVNQGDEFKNPNLNEFFKNNLNLFKLISQGNLGGTGGFTRTLLEASKANISDYHLLMDDDVLIDADVIENAFGFASYSKNTIAVGGQMLDLLRPSMLNEYGCTVSNDGYISPIFSNIDVSNYPELARFNKVTKIDYNAWWFCMVPTKSIAEIKLPAPIFIRGDDQEYGMRLKKFGVETVGLPGIALWHEPFYIKVGGWQTYYDFRNRMILSASDSDMKSEKIDKLFLKVFRLLLVHDYQSVKLILEAVKDLSKGIDLFKENTVDIHDRVVKISKKYAPKSVNVSFNPQSDEQANKKWNKTERRVNFAKQIALLSSVNNSKKEVKHLWDRHVKPENVQCSPYVKSNGIQSYHYLYEPDKKVFKELLKEIVEAQLSYAYTIKLNKWKKIDSIKSFEYWSEIYE